MPTKASRKRQKVTAIKGVGPAAETWLKEVFDVRSLKDLAALSTKQIEQGLNGQNGPFSSSQVSQWAVQAQEMVGATGAAKRGGGSGDSTRDRQPKSKQTKWASLATFVVEFQTRTGADGVKETQTKCQQDETAQEQKWQGIETEGLVRWMMDQIGGGSPEQAKETTTPEQMPLPSPAAAPETPSVEAALPESGRTATPLEEKSEQVRPSIRTPVTVEITEVRAFQPPDSATPKVIATAEGTVGGSLKAGEPVSFELSVQLAGPGASEVMKSEPRLEAEMYAYNRSTGIDSHLSEQATDEDHPSNKRMLAETILESGGYRLDCLAMLDTVPVQRGHLRVPNLYVA